ncbi:MAG TPA: nuclear transport factor 2 family protein [Candidatus Angelobacter sp.]|nr:nuclear transport factor 2 family protein [Candidatus Angelobacter sp.]
MTSTSLKAFLAALLLTSIVLLPAQTARKPGFAPPPENTGAIIGKLEEGMRLAALKGAAGWWVENLDEGFTDTDFQGKVSNKAETIELQRSSALIYDTVNLSERTLHVFNGDTAIVTGKMTAAWTYRGQNVSGDFQITRVWVKHGLEWKLAAQQATRIAP